MTSFALKELVPDCLRAAPDSLISNLRRCGHRPRWHTLNLLWSGWVFLTPLLTTVGPSYWWSVALSYPLFLLLFLLVYVRPYRESDIYVAAMTLLACASIPFNHAAWSYAVFACVFVPYTDSLRSSVLKILLIQCVLVIESLLMGWSWLIPLVEIGVCSSAGFGSLSGRINALRVVGQRLSHDEVRRLAALAERERIGRDLHDLLGHTLSLITLKLELSRKLFDRDPDTSRRELTEAETVARHALAEVRAAVTGIRATDLVAELASARLLLESSGVQFEYDDAPPKMPEDIERALALVLREAVTNVARHAQARHAHVDLAVLDDAVHLRISDDGRGGVREYGNGLFGMRERIHALRGSLHVESSRAHGTCLRIDVPLPMVQILPTMRDEPTDEPFALRGETA
ncbi:MAG: sensor histidine kinase [Xanthomonadales bacterium]|nr:sensor histidine kinase [Xanthomonadales bacterium]